MEVRSIYRYARISPLKVREVTREIQGLPVSAALDLLAFTPKKAAFLIGKTLKSAVANAENNANLKVDGLVVKEAVVGEGPTMKRMMARARVELHSRHHSHCAPRHRDRSQRCRDREDDRRNFQNGAGQTDQDRHPGNQNAGTRRPTGRGKRCAAN